MRQRLHDLVGIFFWFLLIAMWVMLVRDGQAAFPTVVDTAGKVTAAGAGVLVITLWWVRHNVGIHRRKGPRGTRPEMAPRTDEDRLGRPLRWSLPAGAAGAASEPHLVIDLDHGVKAYRRP
jgi:hypothetical protein